jgi:hypothetical protein
MFSKFFGSFFLKRWYIFTIYFYINHFLYINKFFYIWLTTIQQYLTYFNSHRTNDWNRDDYYIEAFQIKFDNTKPDGTKRKLLDTSIAKRYGWSPKVSLKSGFFKTIKYLDV